MRCDPRLDESLRGRLWRDPDGLIASAAAGEHGAMLKEGDRSTVVRLDIGGRSYTFKRYNLMGPIHTVVHLLMRSRARWNWINSRRALDAALSTPKPLACLENRLGPLRGRSYYLCEYVEGEVLLDLVRDGRIQGQRLRAVAANFATIWDTLGRMRLSHGDMKATNFIVDGKDEVWMLDLDGMRREWFAPRWRRQRARDRARFMKNWRGLGECEEVFLACVDRA